MGRYNRISGRRTSGKPSRGIRLKARRRLYIQWRLRVRLFYLYLYLYLIISCLRKWKSALHDSIMKLLMIIKKSGNHMMRRRGGNGKCNITNTSTSTIRSYNRLNSFYSEAISDCLEFIKLSSAVPVTDHHESSAALDYGKPNC